MCGSPPSLVSSEERLVRLTLSTALLLFDSVLSVLRRGVYVGAEDFSSGVSSSIGGTELLSASIATEFSQFTGCR